MPLRLVPGLVEPLLDHRLATDGHVDLGQVDSGHPERKPFRLPFRLLRLLCFGHLIFATIRWSNFITFASMLSLPLAAMNLDEIVTVPDLSERPCTQKTAHGNAKWTRSTWKKKKAPFQPFYLVLIMWARKCLTAPFLRLRIHLWHLLHPAHVTPVNVAEASVDHFSLTLAFFTEPSCPSGLAPLGLTSYFQICTFLGDCDWCREGDPTQPIRLELVHQGGVGPGGLSG